MRRLLAAVATLLPIVVAAAIAFAPSAAAAADAKDPRGDQQKGLELFETRVRPVLVKNCYGCHGPKKEHNGLRLDSRERMLQGGDDGPAIVPGKPEESLLMAAVRHESFEMPPEGKLRPNEIADLEMWIRLGAPWPAGAVAETKSLAERARTHWAWQAPRAQTPPAVKDAAWSAHPVDRFIRAKLDSQQLSPAEVADRPTLVRRLSFALTGLPPTPAEIEAFVRDKSPDAYERLVDRLLASPRFGETWARHWMDWVRFAETHGSEGDPEVPRAWQYRDYLIRALNADVPYDQLIREHLAGDLLASPRTNDALGLNESAIGAAHWRMVQHGFQPTDPLEDFVDFTDNQLDVVMKTFQALTVTCARCHDHKFDAISQADYYALFGIAASTRPAQIAIDTHQRLNTNRAALEALRPRIRAALADAWTGAAEQLPERLEQLKPNDAVAKERRHPLNAWFMLKSLSGDKLQRDWHALAQSVAAEATRQQEVRARDLVLRWDLSGQDYAAWYRSGVGLANGPSPPGEFALASGGEQVVTGIYPSGVYSHRISSKHAAVLTSPRFVIDCDSISVQLLGRDWAQARLVVENYPLPRGLIYSQKSFPNGDEMSWVTWDVKYWKGNHAHIELATYDDLTHYNTTGAAKGTPAPIDDGRSYFGVAEVLMHRGAKPERLHAAPPASTLVYRGEAPDSPPELAKHYQRLALEAIEAWRGGACTNEQAELLQALLVAELLPNRRAKLDGVSSLVDEYRRLEAEIPVPRRAPGVTEAAGFDQPLMFRGDPNRLSEAVPRRFLDALGGKPYHTSQSGRLELAEDLVRPTNPLTARVLVNRLWHYLFGRGIVASVDNFGTLGDRPTHRELLDYLALRLIERGWSIKDTIRFLVSSRTYQLASTPPEKSQELDPANHWLSHMPVRRLEAEAIRDALLAVSGRLEAKMYGPGVPAMARAEDQRRRSVYLTIRRNSLSPFLEVFDAPKPYTTLGRRDTTNVPAQSLALLNDPLVIEQAETWAEQSLKSQPKASNEERIRALFVAALGRRPTDEELRQCGEFLLASAAEHKVGAPQIASSVAVWRDLADAVFNLKEFIYVR